MQHDTGNRWDLLDKAYRICIVCVCDEDWQRPNFKIPQSKYDEELLELHDRYLNKCFKIEISNLILPKTGQQQQQSQNYIILPQDVHLFLKCIENQNMPQILRNSLILKNQPNEVKREEQAGFFKLCMRCLSRNNDNIVLNEEEEELQKYLPQLNVYDNNTGPVNHNRAYARLD